MLRRIFAGAFALAILASTPMLAATTTTTATLSTTVYVDLGVGPIWLAANGGSVIYRIDDAQPSDKAPGDVVQPGSPAVLVSTTAHVWAIAGNAGASALVSAGTGISLGSGGGGGGGSVTQGTVPWADDVNQWADVTLGAPSNYGTSPGAVKVPGVNSFITNIPAVSQSGTWNIGNVSGTISLPTGAATSALQTTMNTTLGSPFQAGGSIGNTAFGISGTLPAFAATPTVNAVPQAATTGAASTTGNIAANNTTAVVVKASAGTLYGAQLYGLGSAPAYLKIYNATSATCGSGTPVKRLMIPAASTAANGAGSNISFPVGVAFGTGITYCVTTGIADNDTTAPAASTFLINLDWQ